MYQGITVYGPPPADIQLPEESHGLYANTSLTMAQAAYISAARVRRGFYFGQHHDEPATERAHNIIDAALEVMSDQERWDAMQHYLALTGEHL